MMNTCLNNTKSSLFLDPFLSINQPTRQDSIIKMVLHLHQQTEKKDHNRFGTGCSHEKIQDVQFFGIQR
jgi:hypothetical protein